jgi:LPS-assembly protein
MNGLRVVAALFLLAALSTEAPAQMARPSTATGPVEITANELNYNKEQNIYTAEGDVEMREGVRKLNADFVLYNDTTKDAFAEGHVVFQEEGDVIRAERMSLNTVTQRGVIEQGQVFMKTGNFYVNGTEIEKTGESSYLVHKGEFTTCGWNKPSWTFQAKEIQLTMGDYATARSSTFSILGYKVFYLPWSVFPVKTERQSGFLLPEFQLSSKDGTIFRNAFYWAISQDTDATFYLDWIEDRGFKPGAEYRYWLTDDTKGAWYASEIDDAKYGHERYQIKGEHQQMFGDMSFKTSINYVSDYLYLNDLGLTTLERSESSLRDVAFIEKPLPYSLLTVETDYFQNLTKKDNGATLQYLPSASYFTEYLPLGKSRLYFDLASDLTNFTRPEGEKDARLTVTPTLRMPYSWNGLNFLGSAGLQEKAYADDPTSPAPNEAVHHEAFVAEGDVNAQFLKESSTTFLNLGNLESIISPRLQYNYVQNTTSFENIPSVDPADRVFNANTVTYSLSHYLNAVTADGQAREISLMEISQTYGLTDKLPTSASQLYQVVGPDESRFSDVHSRFTLFPQSTFWFVHDDYWSVSGKGLQDMTNSIHYAVPPGFQVDISHSYVPGVADQMWVNTTVRWRVFDMNYQVLYDLMQRTWDNALVSLTYHPSCWGVTFTVQETRIPRPSDTSFHVSFNLQGITQKIGGY